MKRVKTWTVNTYRRRCNHALVAPDLIDETREFTLDEMHAYIDRLAELMADYPDLWINKYQIEFTAPNGNLYSIRPVPATYEEVNT